MSDTLLQLNSNSLRGTLACLRYLKNPSSSGLKMSSACPLPPKKEENKHEANILIETLGQLRGHLFLATENVRIFSLSERFSHCLGMNYYINFLGGHR